MKQRYEILKTNEFIRWYDDQQPNVQTAIDARLQRIALDGHFGTINAFDSMIELKWGSGLRIYTHKFRNTTVIVLLGGTKNGQQKDINKAKKILARYTEEA